MATAYLRDFIERGKTTQVTAPSGGYEGGQVVKINNMIGIVMRTTAAGELAAICYSNPKVLIPVATAPSAGYPVGTKLYWDVADDNANNSASGNTYIGQVIEAVAPGGTSALINFNSEQ